MTKKVLRGSVTVTASFLLVLGGAAAAQATPHVSSHLSGEAAGSFAAGSLHGAPVHRLGQPGTPRFVEDLTPAADIVVSGTNGTVVWTLDTDGLLLLSGGTFELGGDTWTQYGSTIRSVAFTGMDAAGTTPAETFLPEVSQGFFNQQSATSIDLTHVNTQNVTDMSFMFYYLQLITSLEFPETFSANNVTNMSHMFAWSNSLGSLQLPESFNTSNVQYMDNMFLDMSALATLELPDAFSTANVIDMTNMLAGLSSLSTLVVGPEARFDNTVGLLALPADDVATGNWVQIVPGTEAVPIGLGFWGSSSDLVAASQQAEWQGGTFIAQKFNTVVFDANPGENTVTGETAPVAGMTGVPTDLTSGFASEAYRLASWNTAADGSGVSYAAGEAGYFAAGATTLFAQWEAVDSEPTPNPPPAENEPEEGADIGDAPTADTTTVGAPAGGNSGGASQLARTGDDSRAAALAAGALVLTAGGALALRRAASRRASEAHSAQ